jgi:integrase
MQVHPQETQSIESPIPMDQTGLLEENFAEAIEAISAATDLPATKRAHWICSLRQIAKALDVPLENLAARWMGVRLRVSQLHHARAGIEWKTLANHKSNVKAALLWFRDERGLPRRGTPVTPEWHRLRCRIMDRSRKAKLTGLIRFCSLRGIGPQAVDETAVDTYMRYRAETTALAVDNQARRAIARAWNSCITQIEGWPSQRLIEPPLKSRERLRWEDFPAGLQHDLENHLLLLTKPRRGADGRRLRPCKLSTLRTKRGDVVAYAKMAVRSGTPVEQLSSFSALLDPDVVERTLDAYWRKDGPEPKTFTIDLSKKLAATARLLDCLDSEALERLHDIRANLEQYRHGGLTEKNLTLVRQVLTAEVWREVVNLPGALMVRARSLRDQAPTKAAVTAQIAVAIAILTVAPVRVGNLVSIRLGENLIRPGGTQSPYWLVFPLYDVKNRLDLNFELPAWLTALIDEYVQQFRCTLLRGTNNACLFPTGSGRHKTELLLSIQIKARIHKATGLQITPHQFRHAAAAIFLKHRPGEYETVRRLLGHRNIRTTVNFYCGLETIHATEAFGRIIQQYVQFSPDHA